MIKINAEEVAKDCVRAISGYAKTFPDQMHDQIVIQELIGVLRDCIIKDPERIAPVVEYVTQYNLNKAKQYENAK